jgi:16S rRNA (guanine527-N7)-methyltransferase
LAELGAQYGLEDRTVASLAALLTHLASDERAPTTVRAAERAVDVHVADALSALEFEWVRPSQRLADLGAGAGIPGLVLAAAMGEARVWLVESQESKCAFIAAAAAAMGLANAHVVRARAEQWPEGLGSHDLVTARALAPQPVVMEYAAPLLAPNGRLLDWRGRRLPEEEKASTRAAELLGLSRVEVRRVSPFAGAEERHLHVFQKIADTPRGFPRRPGLARRRPLGGTES